MSKLKYRIKQRNWKQILFQGNPKSINEIKINLDLAELIKNFFRFK